MYSIIFNDYCLGQRKTYKWWLKSSEKIPSGNRPYMADGLLRDKVYHYFIDDIHNWFIDNSIKYKIKYVSKDDTEIIFNKESDAVLFKLTWM